MKNRAQTFDRDVKEMVRKEGLGEPDSEFDAVWRSMTPDMKISLFHHIGMMDMAVSVPTWLGAYNKAFNGNVSGVMKGNEEAAIAYADRTVRVTQGSGSVKDLARIQNGGALLKTFTMFYSFFSVLYQRFAKSFRAFRLSDSTAVGTAKLMQSMFWIWIAPAVVETMILGEPPEDDDEWAEWMIRKVLTYPSQVLIGVRDIVNLEEERFGYNPSPLYDFGKKLVGINDDIVDMATGKKELDEVTAKDVEDLIRDIEQAVK